VLVEDEDNQGIEVPIIDPQIKKSFTVKEADTFHSESFTKEFMIELQKCPEFIRNVAIIGHLHHGKTTFMDMLVQQTHEKKWSAAKNVSSTSCAPCD
jgi:U5 small nuclear ribonucleoprotein component